MKINFSKIKKTVQMRTDEDEYQELFMFASHHHMPT